MLPGKGRVSRTRPRQGDLAGYNSMCLVVIDVRSPEGVGAGAFQVANNKR